MQFVDFEQWLELLTDDECLYIHENYDGDFYKAYDDEAMMFADYKYDEMKDDKLLEELENEQNERTG